MSQNAGPAVLSQQEKTEPNQLRKVELKRLQGGILVAALHKRIAKHATWGGIMLKIHTKRLDAIEVLCLEGQVINGDTETLKSAVQAACDAGDIILDLQNVS